MERFDVVEGLAAPLPTANIDTDVIMPKRYLKGIDKSGLAEGVFHDLRFGPSGKPDDTFVLNRPSWAGASILVVGPNFGAGSSREHAVWGLRQFGICALIGTTYAGIFFDNCARNGLLAITLEARDVSVLSDLAADATKNRFAIDLPAQQIRAGATIISFQLPSLLKRMLMEGLDMVGLTLGERSLIAEFEDKYYAARPWLRIGTTVAAVG